MMATDLLVPHPDDGVLMAMLDREIVDDDLRRHVEGCELCTARAGKLRRSSDAFRELLATVPVPAVERQRMLARTSTRRPGRWSGAIAAGALFIVAGVAVAAMVGDWGSSTSVERNRVGLPTPVAPSTTSPRIRSSAIVSFAPGVVLEIRISSVQRDGVLELRNGEGELASVRSIGFEPSDEIIVLPGAVRIGNVASSRASYSLSIPAGVQRVIVAFDGRRLELSRRDLPSTVRLNGR
jgi:hypothetical protein